MCYCRDTVYNKPTEKQVKKHLSSLTQMQSMASQMFHTS